MKLYDSNLYCCDILRVTQLLSYVYRSAKFDAKFFNFFARLFIYFFLLSVQKVSDIGER